MTTPDKRERLPNRRAGQTFRFIHNGIEHTAILGAYPDGRIGEVFLEAGKAGVDVNVATKETAIALSFALQYGCPLLAMREAMPRRTDGTAEGPIGALLDLLAKEEIHA